MNYLFLDASQTLTFGQVGDDVGFQTFSWQTERNLAARLPALCDEMLAARGLSRRSIDRWGVCTGPGSLTGLRVANAFLRTLAWLTEKPLVGLDLFRWAGRTLRDRGVEGEVMLHLTALIDGAFVTSLTLPVSGILEVRPLTARWHEAGKREAGNPEAGTPEAGTRVAGTPRTEVPETRTPAAGMPETVTSAAKTPEARTGVAGLVVAGTPEAGMPETVTPDAGTHAAPRLAPRAVPSDGRRWFGIRHELPGLIRIDPSPESLHALLREIPSGTEFEDLLRVLPLYVIPSQAEMKLEARP